MNAPRSIALLIVVQALFCGCCTHKDLTKSSEVQASGILGQRFRTTEQLDLIKDKHARILFLARQTLPEGTRQVESPRSGSQHVQVGVVDAGTELCVDQVVRVKELMAILVVIPEYWYWNCTLAKIESGPYAGKKVAVIGEGLLFKRDPATNGSPMLLPMKKDNKSLQPLSLVGNERKVCKS